MHSKFTILLSFILSIISYCSYAQVIEPVIEQKKDVCPSAITTSFTRDDIKAPKSDGICDSGTEIICITSGDKDMIQGEIGKTRADGDSHQITLDVNWVAGKTGTVFINVYYKRFVHQGWGDCDPQAVTFLYTYKINRLWVAPEGVLTGNDVVTATDINNANPKDVSLLFNVTGKSIQKVEYSWNEEEPIEEDLSIGLFGSYRRQAILSYSATRFGTHTVTTRLQDECGDWYNGPTKTVTLHPTCYQDNLSNISLSVSGQGSIQHREGYQVQKGVIYTIAVSGITNFDDHYIWNAQDGGSDIEIIGNTFKVLKDIGSYRIIAVKKPGRDNCVTPPALTIFVGGKSTILEQICPILLPRDLPPLGYPIDLNNIILKYFTFTAISGHSIIVNPGMSLSNGAEIILVKSNLAINPNDADAAMNFIEQTAYDENGRVIAASRSYSDGQGKSLQTQYKNFTQGATIAQATLYDASGRPVITTLPAPIYTNADNPIPPSGPTSDCGEKIPLAYKADFVQAQGSVAYHHTHFDGVAKEQNPTPVDGSTEGTLGWYYSNNNSLEPLTATTSYPYSRTLFHHDGTEEVKSAAGPGYAFRAGGGHLGEVDKEPVIATDTYLNAYLSMREKLDLPRPTSVAGQFFKTVAFDAAGNKSVSYSDRAGQGIISLYFEKKSAPITTSYNFYDLTGRLLCSVSPKGVLAYDGTNFSAIDKTSYSYNYKGWLMATEQTDAGRSEFIYRKDGQIRFSQNAEQRKGASDTDDERYSYTVYDQVGRSVESGEYVVPAGGITFNSPAMQGIVESPAADGGLAVAGKRDRTFTAYDEPDAALQALLPARVQHFVQGSLSYSKKDDAITSWYSYDEQGRVEWMVQQIKGWPSAQTKLITIDYRYGPTGAVQEVAYQKGVSTEQFTHYYSYDKDGRLEKVYTAIVPLVYDKEGKVTNATALRLQASYVYYLHGPLKRVELFDQDKNVLQGIDYVYTVDGKLKSINHADPAKDPAHDSGEAADVFGMSLDYYAGDYSSRASSNESVNLPGYQEQFNGQIKSIRWHSPVEGHQQSGYAYSYDERNQFKKADWGQMLGNTLAISPLKPYHEKVGNDQSATPGYDANGNILNLFRSDDKGNALANYTYHYTNHANKLDKITEGATTNELMNYSYNALGQLTHEKEGDTHKYLSYDVSGKVTEVYADADHKIVTFSYDERGFRLSKTVYDQNNAPIFKTFYVRDGSGNVLATYEENIAQAQPLTLTEQPIYGASRLGMYKRVFDMYLYEISDHLGNVRAVIGEELPVTYLATMEDERKEQEEGDFDNLKGISLNNEMVKYNHTPTSFELDDQTITIDNPRFVQRINNAHDNPKNPIGVAKMLPVYPGDKLKMEVYVKYLVKDAQQNNTALSGIATYVAGAFLGKPVTKDGLSIFPNLDGGASATGIFSALSDVDENQPRAFLSYIVYDKELNPVKFGQVQVSEAAKIPTTNPLLHTHEKLSFEGDLLIEKEGFVYMYVSNQSDENIDVYFDDFKVTHTYSNIVAGGDYYPYGLEMADRQITREDYRYGYQGQYAEKDKETGWNSFKLRMYNPKIARWFNRDPYDQYFSPYLGMGNSPINRVDPNGGWDIYEDGDGNIVNLYGVQGDFEGYTWLASDDTYYGLDEIVVTSTGNFVNDFNWKDYQNPVDDWWARGMVSNEFSPYTPDGFGFQVSYGGSTRFVGGSATAGFIMDNYGLRVYTAPGVGITTGFGSSHGWAASMFLLENTAFGKPNLDNYAAYARSTGGSVGPVLGFFSESASLENGVLTRGSGYDAYGLGIGSPGLGLGREGSYTYFLYSWDWYKR